MFTEVKGKGTYATAERAEKRMDEIRAKWAVEFRYIIMATEDGRYAPVVILNTDQQHYAGGLAHNGICVTF